MKKILICLLLLANFCSGLAFALDAHSETVVGGDLSVIDLVINTDQHQPDDLHYDDHCSHGAAHLTGIAFEQHFYFFADNQSQFLALSQTPKNLYITPFLRPPIS